MNRPAVLICSRQTTRKNKLIDYVGEFHLELLIRLQILPVIVPVVDGTQACLTQYMERMDGLLLVEGDDVEPKRYAARKANYLYLEKPILSRMRSRFACCAMPCSEMSPFSEYAVDRNSST